MRTPDFWNDESMVLSSHYLITRKSSTRVDLHLHKAVSHAPYFLFMSFSVRYETETPKGFALSGTEAVPQADVPKQLQPPLTLTIIKDSMSQRGFISWKSLRSKSLI